MTVVKVFIDKYVVHYGWPEKILTDKRASFESKLFKELCEEAKICKMRTTPYHPMGNGQPERFNRTLLTMIGTLPRVEKANSQNWVNHLTHAYNCTKSQVTGFSPYYLMFGREPRTPVDDAFEVTFPFRQDEYMIMCIISGKDYNRPTILLRSILIKMLPNVNFTMI